MRSRYFVAVFSVCAVLFSSCAQGSAAWAADTSGEPNAASPLPQSLLAAQQALYDATRNKDIAYVKKAVTDDFVLIKTTGESAERDELIEEAQKGSIQSQPRMYNIQAIPLNGDAAILTYDVVLTDSKPRYQHISSTWVKRGDQWKLRFQQSTPNLFSLGDE
jgi:ketosteroid isomerase-like protein